MDDHSKSIKNTLDYNSRSFGQLERYKRVREMRDRRIEETVEEIVNEAREWASREPPILEQEHYDNV